MTKKVVLQANSEMESAPAQIPVEEVVSVLEAPDMEETHRMEWALSKKVSRFDGEDTNLWANYVAAFEKLACSKGWDRYEGSVQVELLSFRLEGKARKLYELWNLEDPALADDYLKFKEDFPGRFEQQVGHWKRMSDYQNLQMEKGETTDVYIARFKKASGTLSTEEKDVVKFFFSLSDQVRTVVSHYGGEWPRKMEEMMRLVSELMGREEAIQYVQKTPKASVTVGSTTNSTKVLQCWGCKETGHIKINCPRQQTAKDPNEQINNIKDKTIKDYSYVYVYPMFSSDKLSRTAKTLVDSGVASHLMSEVFADSLQLFRTKLRSPKRFNLATRGCNTLAREKSQQVLMQIGRHVEMLEFFIIPNLTEDVILGKTWLAAHNPEIDWVSEKVEFTRCTCQNVEEKQDVEEEYSFGKMIEPEVESFKVDETEADEETEAEDEDDEEFGDEFEEEMIARVEDVVTDESTDLVDDFLNEETKKRETLRLPEEYQEFQDVFSKELSENLPPLNSKYQCEIDFKDNVVLPKPRKPFSLSLPERKALAEYIDENLKKGFIRKSKSPIAMGTFLVGKSNGEYRTVVDFRPVNEIVVDNRNPIPCIEDLMSFLCEARIFTKIDLRGAYNLLRIRPGDEWKTAFVCPQGQFEYMVMPFGLKTAPAIFQSMMEDIFSDLLGKTVLIYLDDILIFSQSVIEHADHVREVLNRLQANRLLGKLEKCVFSSKEVNFLGFVISDKGISVAQDKVEVIMNWPKPLRRKDLKSFLGTANFNRKFVANYSEIVAPLLLLDSKKIKNFAEAWDENCDKAFVALKVAMTSTPVLRHVDFNLPFVLESDASDFALGAVLLQPETMNSNILHPVAYASRKLVAAERNYSVYDKELLGLVFAFKKWHQFLFGARYPIRVRTDHANLQYFQTRQLLNNRHLRWKLFFQNYDFRLTYLPGSANVVADALSRRVDHVAGEEYGTSGTSRERHQEDTILDPECWEGLNRIHEIGIKEEILDKEKQREIMKARHSTVAAGHFGRMRTFEAINKDFTWPGMRADIYKFVDSCIICQKIKPSRKKEFGKLMPLPVPSGPWKSISLDFIVKLPISNGYDSILVVVDRFSKMCHLIPCNESIDAPQTAELLLKNVFKHHGLPMDMVSDRGTQFTSRFWSSICEQMGIQRKLSTAAHPQTDGQTERTNQTLEQYLKAFVNYKQDNWANLLHFAEMAMNNAVSSSTKRTPFEINIGYSPNFDYLANERNFSVPAADIFMGKLKEIWIETIKNLRETASRMKENTRKLRRSHDFKIGDQVWLDTKHLRRNRPTGKLDYLRVGPYPIVKKINENAFELGLPLGSRLSRVVNVSKMTPFVKPEKEVDEVEPDPEIIDGFEEFEVESILDSRIEKGVKLFLIKWKGYNSLHNSWEPEHNLTNCGRILSEYMERQGS